MGGTRKHTNARAHAHTHTCMHMHVLLLLLLLLLLFQGIMHWCMVSGASQGRVSVSVRPGLK